MKISSASKKVLASALSAAMVVAFAPTVALAGTITNWDSTNNVSTGITDTEALTAGYSFKQTASNGTRLVTTYYTSDAIANVTSGTVYMMADTNIDDVNKTVRVKEGVTLDLGGHRLTSSYEVAGDKALLNVEKGAVVKNGSVDAADFTAEGAKTPTVVPGIWAKDAYTLDGVSVDSVIGGKTMTAKGTVAIAGDVAGSVTAEKNAVVTTGAITRDVTVKQGASVTAKKEAKNAQATAIGGAVEFQGKDSSVSATATTTGNTDYKDASNNDATADVTATAVAGKVTTGAYEGVSLTAAAIAEGTDANTNDTNYANATAFASSEAVSLAKGQTLKASASVADDEAVATGVKGALTVATGASAEVSAKGSTDNGAKDVAVEGTLTAAAGTFTGKITGDATSKSITGGTYTADPAKFVNLTNYDVVDNGTSFTVKQADGFTVKTDSKNNLGTADERAAIKDAVEAALAGKTGAAALAFAKDYDLSKAQELASAQKLTLKATATTGVTEKRATDAQKAALEAANAYAVKTNSVKKLIGDLTFTTVELYTTDADKNEVKVADVTGFGTTGTRNAKDNTVVIGTVAKAHYSDTLSNGTIVATVDASGNVAPVELTKNADGDYDYLISSTPVAYVGFGIDLSSLKPSTPEQPSAEKATQGIDVAKKSKTVKLAKKATKTKKAQSFSMGVSAETAVTTAKKSGSKYVTVKGGKVTLKKGVKKGTYTAKVSIKAAASDQYLAAAKTVTVKFTVKK